MIGTLDDAAARIAAAQKILLTCHLGPDGDALGSMSSLGALLREAGRTVVLFNPDPAPRNLRFLPGLDGLVKQPGGPHDLTIVVDCGDAQLLGPRFPGRETTGPLVVLDHHAASRPFGDVYVCDPGAASVGVLVARLAVALGLPISAEAAQGIFVSLVSDTGSFRYANTNSEAFNLAASLVADRGVDPWAVAQKLGEEVPLARYRLLAAALGALELVHDGRVAVMTVTEEMVRAAGAKWEHSEGLVNYARALEGVECGVFIAPSRDGGARISLRTKGRVDAGAICAPLGGGGHRGAAGCSLPTTLAEARTTILEAVGAALPPKP
jgi:bifunctional oligoribonuclease and PAP phosphatase NrnA